MLRKWLVWVSPTAVGWVARIRYCVWVQSMFTELSGTVLGVRSVAAVVAGATCTWVDVAPITTHVRWNCSAAVPALPVLVASKVPPEIEFVVLMYRRTFQFPLA